MTEFLKTFTDGETIFASDTNANNLYLLNQIQTLASVVENNKTFITSALADYESIVYPIGSPKITLTNTLQDNEIWLEGAEVSKTDYATLYTIYGSTYGAASNSNNFILPDFRNRALWGNSEFGYINAGLPNITGSLLGFARGSNDGCCIQSNLFYSVQGGSGPGATWKIDASKSNNIYGSSSTVQPPAIKIRVKTRYE